MILCEKDEHFPLRTKNSIVPYMGCFFACLLHSFLHMGMRLIGGLLGREMICPLQVRSAASAYSLIHGDTPPIIILDNGPRTNTPCGGLALPGSGLSRLGFMKWEAAQHRLFTAVRCTASIPLNPFETHPHKKAGRAL